MLKHYVIQCRKDMDDFVQALEGRLDLKDIGGLHGHVPRLHLRLQADIPWRGHRVRPLLHHQAVNDVVNRIRIEEAWKSDLLAKTNYCWLKNPENLTPKQEERMNGIKDLDLLTAQAYHLNFRL